MEPVKKKRSDRMVCSGSGRGFSLAEVVIALGVVSFALVGILSIFPLALETAGDSKAEMRIASISQSIFTDLKTSKASRARLITRESPGQLSAATVKEMDLSIKSDAYALYDVDGSPLQETDSTAWTGRSQIPGAVFISKLHFEPYDPSVPGAPVISGLSRVDLTLETPAIAPQANRKKYTFSWLLKNQ